MGFLNNISTKIRTALSKDKEKTALRLAKGSTSPSFSPQGYDLLQAYGYDVLSDYLRLEHDLLSRYVDYEEMDDYGELASALDIYADDATQVDSTNRKTMWVHSNDKDVETLLMTLFHKTLRVEEELWEIARTLCKYGNDYEEILVTEEGVQGLNFLPPPTVRRIEGPRGELFGFLQDFKGRFGFSPTDFEQLLAVRSAAIKAGKNPKDFQHGAMEQVAALEEWEVAHFRIRSKQRRSLYGYSIMEPARWIWKRLVLLEDAAMIYRLQRAPERFAFYVDVGDMPPAEALAYVNKVRQMHKKKKFYDPSTGKLSLKWEPLSQDDDFWVPSRKGADSTRIEVMGSPNWQHMDDIDYFLNKLFAAIKVPKAYLGQEEGVGRAVLSSEDVRFARSVLRVQREIRMGFHKIGRVHLAALNIPPDRVEWDLGMTAPSAIFELAQLEVRNARADLAGRMREFVSLHWIMSKVFGMNDEEIEEVIQQKRGDVMDDTKTRAEAEATAQSIMTGAEPGEEYEEEPVEEPEVEQPGGETEVPQESIRHRRVRRVRPITERELFRGNREYEKRLEDKIDLLMKSDNATSRRLRDLRSLMQEIRFSRIRPAA